MTTLRLLVLVPVLVISAGIVVLLLGRSATIEASEGLARKRLAAHARDVRHDVIVGLDQAEPILERLRTMADPRMSPDEYAPRMLSLVSGRPAVKDATITFASGTSRSLALPNELVPSQTTVHEWTSPDELSSPSYAIAATNKLRSWVVVAAAKGPRIVAAEPIFGIDGELVAVTSVELDVAAMSPFMHSAPFGGITDVITRDGATLTLNVAHPAIATLLPSLPDGEETTFASVSANGHSYLAAMTPVGGTRSGIEKPLDWFVVTFVLEDTLAAPTKGMQTKSLFASGGALLLALGLALLLAWNVMRMRRDVVAAKAREESANAKIRELGAYRLIEKLGAGGMGEVWRAEHRLLAREAAVKLVREEGIVDEDGRKKALARFKREAETLARMKSRHTIMLYDYGIADDGASFYYVMELLDGVDLDNLVRQAGAIPAARVIKILIAACQSLGEAHEAGLLHRDIKPANIVLSRAADEVDVVKVLDFGIVHALGEDAPGGSGRLPETKLTRDGALVGTPGYMAPELMRGEKVDGRADLYALGCVAWWLLARGEVFPRPDGKAAMRNHMYLPVPDLRMHVHGWLPDELATIVTSLLAKHPDERPASARVLADMLRAIAIPAEHAWTEERARAWWAERGDPEGKTVVDKPRVIKAMTLNTASID